MRTVVFLSRKARLIQNPMSPSTSASSEPSVPAVDPATLQLKQDLIDWHFQVVKLCQKIGIPDVCQTYKEARLENILKGLSGKDLKCKLCHKGYYNRNLGIISRESTSKRLNTIVISAKNIMQIPIP